MNTLFWHAQILHDALKSSFVEKLSAVLSETEKMSPELEQIVVFSIT